MKNIKNTLIKNYYRCQGVVKKNSPEILATIGVAGVITSGVMACKATLKLPEILEETKDTVDKIHEVNNDPSYADKYSDDDAKRDMAITYVQTGVKVAKVYTPAIVLGTFSIGCLLGSNQILKKRNAGLAAAYMTIDKTFKEYRSRVTERFGEDVEREIRFNVKTEEVEKTVVDENGNETTVTETVKVANPNLYSDYARFFDETCFGWNRNPEYNLMFLKSQQNYANDLLVSKGILFLNEVYELLGMEKTKAGQVVGWVYDPQYPTGDNFVDFGLYDMSKERVRAFINGYEANILLDFNVDGNVWELMK